MSRRQDLRLRLVYAALEHVSNEGWTENALKHAARDLGGPDSLSWRLFPGGINQAIQIWNEDIDKKMVSGLEAHDLEDMRVRDRVALAVKLRLEALAPNKDAARVTAKYLALPHHAPLGAKMLFKTVDEMWYQAGDRSKDYNWYTKRGLLSGVYASAFLYWLNDRSQDHQRTWIFLDHRIDDVMKMGRFPRGVVECCKEVPGRVSALWKAIRP